MVKARVSSYLNMEPYHFFSLERTIGIRTSRSTSATSSLSSYVSVEMSFSELSGVKWYE